MRIEIIIFIIVIIVSYHIYTDGTWINKLLLYKKYYQIAGVVLFGLLLYWLFKYNPEQARKIIMTSNEYVKYLPVDKNTSSFISPILDFTNKFTNTTANTNTKDYINPRIFSSGGGEGAAGTGRTCKRSVSETKKKYVAAEQSWKCGHCGEQLKSSFEIDHKISLENGGDNNINNLIALCRSCHGEKTTLENL